LLDGLAADLPVALLGARVAALRMHALFRDRFDGALEVGVARQQVLEVAGAELQQAANYLNTEFAGLPLLEVRAAVLTRLQQERTLYDELLTRALRLAQTTLADLPQSQNL